MGKHVFLSLTAASAGLVALIIFMFWKVMQPGLAQINMALPMVWGIICAGAVLLLLSAMLAIVIILLGLKLPKLVYILAWKLMNMLFPLAIPCFLAISAAADTVAFPQNSPPII